jgi:hypothetical protein
MTAAAQRQKIQQLGFWDPDVAQPLHDDITQWNYDRWRADWQHEQHSATSGTVICRLGL